MLKSGLISLASIGLLIGANNAFATKIWNPANDQDEEGNSPINIQSHSVPVNNQNEQGTVTVTIPSNSFLLQNLDADILLGAGLLLQIQQNAQAQNQLATHGQTAPHQQ